MSKKSNSEYFCVAVRRNDEDIWCVVSKHNTQAETQAELEKRRDYTGAFNYDNAELQVLSHSQAKQEFGAHREYKPIGSKNEGKPS
jgi:hypothetical protein